MRDAVLEHHLRRLDPDARAALVADLWAARGYETTREGPFVFATRGDESTVLAVEDTVRSPTGTDSARFLDAATLAELLRYAVAPATAADLCERHLGARPGALSPPRSTRLRRRLHALFPSATLVSAVVALALLVGLAGVAGLTLTGPATPVPAAAGTATPLSVPGSPTPPDGGDVLPPGTTAGGLTDPAALAAAHRRALDGGSYTLWVDRYRVENGTRREYDADLTVARGTYLLRTSVGTDGDRRPLRTVYYDGTGWYVAESPGGNTTYLRVGAEAAARLGPDPFTLEETLVTRYLSTPETTVAGRVVEDGEEYTRLVARGAPDGFEGVESYEAVALVDDDGLVADLTVEYTEDGSPVRFEATYGRVGWTVVSVPGWYEWEFPAAGTGTPAG